MLSSACKSDSRWVSLFFCDSILICLQAVPSLFSCTFDAWTSKAFDPYLSVTVHYIYAPPKYPTEWELNAEILGFTEIHGSHSGANLGSTFLGVLDRYGIRRQVCWFSEYLVTRDTIHPFHRWDGLPEIISL